MSILYLLVLIPVATMVGIVLSKNRNQTRWTAAIGMFLQLVLAVSLMVLYLSERKTGNSAIMLFFTDHVWFKSLNIHLITGIDGISVSMILLTAIVVFAGVFASWEMESLRKEFFISLILLATGVFGFFISLDLFTMFLFYELAVIPMYLLIGIWGTGPKEYSAMKLTLMLMGGSALLLVGLLGIYFNSSSFWRTIDFQHSRYCQSRDTNQSPTIILSLYFCRVWYSGSFISFPYMVSRWPCFCTNCCFDVACRRINETWRLRGFQSGYVPVAGSCSSDGLDISYPHYH